MTKSKIIAHCTKHGPRTVRQTTKLENGARVCTKCYNEVKKVAKCLRYSRIRRHDSESTAHD